ncbi:uncharacterized protein VTP21DRAFT_8853 [Calcarisporiella thermophila]|uniref:uncharacterized protein n=1 Tax=Calcarisporiella thermophila TaxID=911321 RepID=UPI0037429B36
MTIVVQTSSLDDSRAPNRGSDTTLGSSTSQHNPRLEENETIELEKLSDLKKDNINDVEVVEDDGMEKAENEDDNHPGQREWGRPAIRSYHSAILSTHSDTTLSDVDIALEGRVLNCVARSPLLPYPITLINVYAPSAEPDTQAFYDAFPASLSQLPKPQRLLTSTSDDHVCGLGSSYDHMAIQIEIRNTAAPKSGYGQWRFNSSLADDELYTATLKAPRIPITHNHLRGAKTTPV